MPDRIHTCPSPDDCDFTTPDVGELAAHINDAHPGEFKREDWPDTAAGRASRAVADGESDEE